MPGATFWWKLRRSGRTHPGHSKLCRLSWQSNCQPAAKASPAHSVNQPPLTCCVYRAHIPARRVCKQSHVLLHNNKTVASAAAQSPCCQPNVTANRHSLASVNLGTRQRCIRYLVQLIVLRQALKQRGPLNQQTGHVQTTGTAKGYATGRRAVLQETCAGLGAGWSATRLRQGKQASGAGTGEGPSHC